MFNKGEIINSTKNNEKYVYTISVMENMSILPDSPYRAEPPGTERTEPDRRPADPVRLVFSKNHTEPLDLIRFGSIPPITRRYGPI